MTATEEHEQIIYVQGMDCADCARTVEKGVRGLAGVEGCSVHIATGRLRVTGRVSREEVARCVRALGYTVAAEPDESGAAGVRAPTQEGTFWQFLWQRPATRLALLGGLLIVPGLVFDELLGIKHPLIDLASIGALLAAGLPIARSAWQALVYSRLITINVLMTIAAVGAVMIGATTEAGMVMVLFALGEALEGYTASRARASIHSLMQVMPTSATLLRRASAACTCGDGCCTTAPAAQSVPIESLQVGDVILVRPGEQIPVDGRVIAGESAVNQAPITGESSLVEKLVGDEVFASSINGQGALDVAVSQLAQDSTISRLIRMVEEAQEQRAPTQRFIDQFAQYYTPAVVLLAALIATIPPLLLGQPFWNAADGTPGWFYRALTLLVVACPCALVISTPVSIISAISSAARNGVLIKGGAYLETLSRVRTMAFDKTGTLTTGKPSVIRVRSATCTDDAPEETCTACNDLLALAGSLEQRSDHPLAHAIVVASQQRGLQDRYPAAEDVTALVGSGVRGRVGGQQVILGSHRYFDAAILHSPQVCAEVHQDAAAGYTPVLVGADGSYLGTITLADTPRASSSAALAQLKQAGIEHLVMLTGDNDGTAQRIGTEVGLTEVYADLLPDEKVQAVHRLKQRGRVAMVGDGINDAPALAAADVSIAIGGQAGGTAQAMETADIVMMRDDLRLLPFAIRLSHATMRTIHSNVVVALGLKLAFLVLVLLGLGTMWMAVVADMGASLLVSLYGMHLLAWGRPERVTMY